jgi:hypothetical protein
VSNSAEQSDAEAIAEKLADLAPEVRKFLTELTPERVKYLDASIQFSRDRETAAIVAGKQLIEVFGKVPHP